jgi:hypothetical protein
MTASSPSDEGLEGIRVQLRMLVAAEPEQRFDVHGSEVLQLRGYVIDARRAHPGIVVRFSGQRRAELYRWAKPDKHLGVDGFLEIKHWMHAGKPRVTLLVEAVSIFPLGEVDIEPSRSGIYAVRGRTGVIAAKAPPANKEERAKKARELLDLADA